MQSVVVIGFALLFLNSCGKEALPIVASIQKPDVAGVRLAPKAFTTSANKPGNDPALVADGDTGTGWTAGAFPPQWIQLDLGENTSISKVLLNVNQYPNGSTTQELHGGSTPDNLILLATFRGDTKSSEWIEMNVAANDVRFLRIVTAFSPSWVGWQEIEVYK